MFPDAVCERLAIVGVAAADIADERMRMSELAFGRTRNRSLLGTLNDFAFMAQSGDARRTEPESPEELMRFLSQTPILPLDGHGVSGRSVREVGRRRRRRRDIVDERVRMLEIGVRADQEPQLAWHFERLRIHGSIRQRSIGPNPSAPEELMQFLSQTPILPLDGASPIELTRAAFGRQSVP